MLISFFLKEEMKKRGEKKKEQREGEENPGEYTNTILQLLKLHSPSLHNICLLLSHLGLVLFLKKDVSAF